ncbi:MAG: nucleotide exchange factor GrpE [Betaproteobacteria bacterium]|nr:nucleotide exchange factor GrpE [Betaproteobacteria bacterium]
MSEAPQNEPAPVTEAPPAADAAAAQAAPAEPAAPSLDEQLAKAEAAAAEHRDAFLRAKAETENLRKRAQEDVAKAHKYAVENFATELLAVKDALEAGLATENASAESLKSGMELTLKQLTAAFGKHNLAEENPAGQKFDPHKHQAISMVEADAEPNTVVAVLQKGYKLNDRVIRPALVTVAKAKDA